MSASIQMTFQPYNPPANSASVTISVTDVSFDMEQVLNIGSSTAGAGAGKVTFNPISFTKAPDVHSADLFQKMCSGTPYQKVTLTITGAIPTGAATATPYFTFTMGLVAIKTISFAIGESGSAPAEVVTMEYGACAYSVAPIGVNNVVGTAVASAWNRVTNLSVAPSFVGS